MGLIYEFDILVSRPQNYLCICIWISVMIICSLNLICLSTQLTVRHGTAMYYRYMCRYMDRERENILHSQLSYMSLSKIVMQWAAAQVTKESVMGHMVKLNSPELVVQTNTPEEFLGSDCILQSWIGSGWSKSISKFPTGWPVWSKCNSVKFPN